MTSDELESKVADHITTSTANGKSRFGATNDEILVIKYLPASRLNDPLRNQQLYASERAGFTWGDALYVAPIAFPRSTMMYGQVGVVGTWNVGTVKIFDASDPAGVALYQEWITWQSTDYLELTTTVHADLANRSLRNEFRNRFDIDCVCFRPDEDCADYVDQANDWWLAITHWDASRRVGSGHSKIITNLKWCVIGPDAFSKRADTRGYDASLHVTHSQGRQFIAGHYTTLETDIRSAYAASSPEVVLCDFR